MVTDLQLSQVFCTFTFSPYLIRHCLSLDFTGFSFFQDIEFVQVPDLLYGIGMQIIVTVLIFIIPVDGHVAVTLVAGGVLVDIEAPHPLMVEEGVVAGHLVELLMGLGLVLGHSEVKA
jgi:hypothetical protein